MIWLLDYLTKQWALHVLPGREIKLIGTFLKLQLTSNNGAAFGLGASNSGVLLGLFSCTTIALVAFYAPRITNKNWAWVLALVLGGAIGNLTDRAFNEPRLLRGAVTDWILLPHWPNFNLADCAVVLAAILAFGLTLRNISPIEVGKNA